MFSGSANSVSHEFRPASGPAQRCGEQHYPAQRILNIGESPRYSFRPIPGKLFCIVQRIWANKEKSGERNRRANWPAGGQTGRRGEGFATPLRPRLTYSRKMTRTQEKSPPRRARSQGWLCGWGSLAMNAANCNLSRQRLGLLQSKDPLAAEDFVAIPPPAIQRAGIFFKLLQQLGSVALLHHQVSDAVSLATQNLVETFIWTWHADHP